MGKQKNIFKRAIAYFLTMCMLVTSLFVSDYTVAQAEEGDEPATTTVYFYNSDNWQEVYAHAWTTENLTGVWPGQKATDLSEELGNDWLGWWRYEVPRESVGGDSFNIIFNNGNSGPGNQTDGIGINNDGGNHYVTADGKVSPSVEDAEVALGKRSGTTVYFLNSIGWSEVAAHAYGGTAAGVVDWPGRKAEEAPEIGGNWWKVTIPQKTDAETTDFRIIFNNNMSGGEEKKAEDLQITGNNSYVTFDGTNGDVYDSKEEAEAAIGEIPVTTLYYYNSTKWTDVYAYCYADEKPIDKEWPGDKAEPATNIGEDWYKVEIKRDASNAPFRVIFNNGLGENDGKEVAEDCNVTRKENNYISKTGLYSNRQLAEFYASGEEGTTIYFYNSGEWGNVNAYVYGHPDKTTYGNDGEVLGTWPGVQTEIIDTNNDGTADEGWENWVKVVTPVAPPFSIKIYNADNDKENSELYLESAEHVYVAINNTAYTSKDALIETVTNEDAEFYFLNSEGWEEVWAYGYDSNNGDVGPEMPGTKAEKVADMDGDWYKVTIDNSAILNPFNVKFHNNKEGDGKRETEGFYVTQNKNNYASIKGLYGSENEAATSVGLGKTTKVYFLNSKDWSVVGTYVYGVTGVGGLGVWDNTDLTEENYFAKALDKTWYELEVPAVPPFSIIFYNNESAENEKERAELQIPNATQIWVTGSNEVWGSQEEAELAEGLGDPSKMTTVYFLNHRGWGDINGYTFVGKGTSAVEFGAPWPGKAATREEELGENWWSLTVPKSASEDNPFSIVFNDGLNQTEDTLIKDKTNIYMIANGTLYATKEEAEAAAKNDDYDDGCETGPNKDIENYNVVYNGAGAALPYVTYEAENAATNATVLEDSRTFREDIQSEASGRKAVELDAEGEYVEFTLSEAANSVVLRYSIPDSTDGTGIDASLSLYVDGAEKQDLALTSKYAWVYGSFPYTNKVSDGLAHRFYDEVRVLFDQEMPAGTKIKLQKDAADTAANYVIDFIDCELVGPALTQPENSLSVTDFGAVADDDTDDAQAFIDCIKAAEESGKEVWIPKGTFLLSKEEPLQVKGVTIRGAGMWYTNLVGAGVSFYYKGTCKFYDFAMTGVSTVRDDKGDLAGFEGVARATNVTIQNIWMEHIKVGVWSKNTNGLAILGCRIRNTYADGINMSSGTYNSLAENNSVRTTGDDCIAIWPETAEGGNNTIRHNTIMAPDLANGAAVYGGYGHVVENNHISDIINNGSGICLGSEFDTAKGYTGTIKVSGNLLERCGSYQTDTKYPIGAIWVWSTWHPMTTGYIIENNTLKNNSYSAFLIDCQSEVDGVVIRNNTVDGATDVIHIRRNGTGKAQGVGNVAVNYTGKYLNNEDPNFTFTLDMAISGVYGQQVKDMVVTGPAVDNAEGEWTVDATAEGATDIPEVGTEKAYKVIFTSKDGKTTEAEVVPTIAQKPVIVTVENKTKVYGEENPAFTFKYDKEVLVGDDTDGDLAVTLESNATAASDAGTYRITGTSASKNYAVTVMPGILTIQKADAVINIADGKDNYVKKLGDADFALEGITTTGGIPVYALSEGKNIDGQPKAEGEILSVTEDGIVTILGSGSVVITVSLEESKNYNAAESKKIAVLVEARDGFSVNEVEQEIYTGKAIKPEPSVIFGLVEKGLEKGKDYTLTYKNNIKVYTLKEGDAGFDVAKAPQVVIKGKGNFAENMTLYFTIQPKNIEDKDVVIDYTDAFIENGKNQIPLQKITYGGTKLKTTDYKVEYFPIDNDGNVGEALTGVKEPGTYKMVITGKYDATAGTGNFTGRVEKDINVYGKEGYALLKNMVITIEGRKTYSKEYTGEEIKPSVTVTPKGKNQTPVSEDSYTVSYQNNVNVGTATITIKGNAGKGIVGTVTKTFKITGVKLAAVAKVNDAATSDGTLIWQSEVPYNVVTGAAVQPVDAQSKNLVTLTYKNEKYKDLTFTEGVDYKVSYKKNDKPGTATMVFTGIGKYTGTVTKTFKVTKLTLNEEDNRLSITADKEATYAKKGGKINILLTYDGVTLVEGKDYKVTYKNNKAVTTVETAENKKPEATISGLGAFSGKISVKFDIKAADLETDVSIMAANKAYQNKKGKYKSVPVLTDGEGTKLANNKDFTCEYYLMKDGQETPLTNNDIVALHDKVKVVATAKGNNFVGSTSAEYEIVEQDISKASVNVKAKVYTGKTITLTEEDFTKIKVGDNDLVLGTDYEILGDYQNNINKGTASVTIKGIGNYGGTKKVTFKITSRTMAWWWNLFK